MDKLLIVTLGLVFFQVTKWQSNNSITECNYKIKNKPLDNPDFPFSNSKFNKLHHLNKI